MLFSASMHADAIIYYPHFSIIPYFMVYWRLCGIESPICPALRHEEIHTWCSHAENNRAPVNPLAGPGWNDRPG